MKLNVTTKEPLECTNIGEVRTEIDNIDRTIISLLGKRFGYVREVVKYKDGTAKGIEATDRKNQVLETRRQWAESEGLSADVVERLYVTLIDYFIEEEKKIANKN